MTIQETFIKADQTLNNVVSQIKDAQWDMQMPENFIKNAANSKTTTLRDVINYHAYDEAWIPDMVAGKTMEEVGKEKYDGDLLGESPKENFAAWVEKSVEAVHNLHNLHDLTRVVHYTYGDYPADEALSHAIIFRGFRAHDLAIVIGVNSDLPTDLVQAMWDIVEPQSELLRKMGVFPPKLDVPHDASLQSRLLGLSGRRP